MNQASKYLILIVVLGGMLSMQSHAQFNTTAQSAREGALGGCFVFSPHVGLVDLAYRQGYGVTGTAEKGVRVQLPTHPGGVAALAYNHFGNSAYHEQQALVAYALRVSRRVYVGVGGRWLQMGSQDVHYRDRQWLAAILSVHVHWSDVEVGLLVTTRPWDAQRPWGVTVQTAYRPSTQWLALVQLASEECLRWRAGLEYRYDEHFCLRAGVASRPLTLTFGGGLRMGAYAVDVAVEAHNTLGINPQLSLRLWF